MVKTIKNLSYTRKKRIRRKDGVLQGYWKGKRPKAKRGYRTLGYAQLKRRGWKGQPYTDSDGDGKVNTFDCQPLNAKRQDSYTRLAQTDEQEQSIRTVQGWVSSIGKKIVGGTTIGKSPQTVILDLTYQGGEVYIQSDGKIEVLDERVRNSSEFKEQLGYLEQTKE